MIKTLKIDEDVFLRHSAINLRKMIGNYGGPVRRVRPEYGAFSRWIGYEGRGLNVQAWMVFDHSGWQRDLLHLPISSFEYKTDEKVVLRFHGLFPFSGISQGVLVRVDKVGLILNPWQEGPAIGDRDSEIVAKYSFECSDAYPTDHLYTEFYK